MTVSTNRRAARAVAMYGPESLVVRRELLEAIGVIRSGEREILPDVAMVLDGTALIADFDRGLDDTTSSSARVSNISGTMLAKQTGPCEASTAPPGLWNPPAGKRVAPRALKSVPPKPPKPPIDETGRISKRQRKPIDHGTVAGYRGHLRYKDPACDECKEANRAYSREGYERRMGRSA